MEKDPYLKPMIPIIKQQRPTLKEFKEDFDMYLSKDCDTDFDDAIITGVRMVDDPTKITDGAIVFDCYLPAINCEGTFTVTVRRAHDAQ